MSGGRIGYLDPATVAAAIAGDVGAQLSLGTAATADTGTSGAAVPLLDTSNTWSAQQTFADVDAANILATGTLAFKPAASATPSVNGQLTFELTSDTTLKIKVKGSDGTVRSVSLTLA